MSPEVRSGRADLGPIASRAEAPASLEIPSPHLGLDWRPLKLADAHTLHGLVAAIEHADGLVSRAALGDVEEWLRRPWHHLSSDSLAGFDHLGELRAYGLVAIEPGESSRVRALLDGGVHPEWRGVGVGRALVAWMEGRGRQLLAGTGAEGPASLAVYVDASVRDRRAMYAAAGFSPVRWFTELRRSLTEPIPELPAPDGVRVLPWCEEL
ncbi:MAG TPA: GNAT family N-acetyltransferase, partial [Actinotalea sp.]|nr:GNAT family N-acetyltransferase [Actinotalea sp.]